jgi:branched-chain amino acid transport system substrate-binding protein
MNLRTITSCAVFCIASAFSYAASAEIIIGFSGDLSGQNAARTKAMVAGAEVLFNDVNARGGVRGSKIKFVTMDDEFKADKTLANVKAMLAKHDPVALFQIGGAPSVAAILDVLKDQQLPLVGSVSGADSLRKFHPYVFHLKARFGQEIDVLARHIGTLAQQSVAVIAINLPIGNEGSTAIEKAFAGTSIKLTKTKVAQDLSDLDKAIDTVRAANPQATLVLSPTGPGVKIIKKILDNGISTQIYCLSVMSSQNLFAALGDKSRGIAITQTVPLSGGESSGVSREFLRMMSDAKISGAGVDHMEGFVSAKALVEALQRTKGTVSRSSLIASLERMRKVDLGGYFISFAPGDHEGSDYVEITLMSKQGKLIR